MPPFNFNCHSLWWEFALDDVKLKRLSRFFSQKLLLFTRQFKLEPPLAFSVLPVQSLPPSESFKWPFRPHQPSNPVVNSHRPEENSTNKYTLTFKNPRNESILWYGPYIGLPPGKYTLTFRIKIVGGNNISESDLVLKLNIHAYVEDVTILNKTLKFSEAKNGEWIEITLTLNITSPDIFEFRGISTGAPVTIYLDYIKLKQIEAYP